MLILIHAFPLHSTMLEQALQSSLPSGWTAITPDVPGFGTSKLLTTETLDMTTIATMVHQVIPEGTSKLVIGGISMGGYITEAFVRLYPDLADGYILSNTNDFADKDGGKARMATIELIKQGGRGDFIANLIPRLLGETSLNQRRHLIDEIYAMFEESPDQAIIQVLRGMAKRVDSGKTMSAVKEPILLIAGDEDEMTGPEVAQDMNRRYQNSQLQIVARTGHYSVIEDPKRYGEAIYSFLEQLGP